MLPKLIHYNYSRPTREVNTNLPNSLSQFYSPTSPRQGLNPLPPILSPNNAKTDPNNLKKILFEKRILRDLSTHREKKERILKGKVVERFWQDFNILIPSKNLKKSVFEVVELGYYLFRTRLMNQAAQKIQKNWKKFRFSKGLKDLKARKESAALKIQRNWRIFYKKKILPQLEQSLKEKSAVFIQKVFRGFSARLKFSLLRSRLKLKEQLKFFDEICDQVKLESVLIIQKNWKKYKNRKNANKPNKKNIGKKFARTVRAVKAQRKVTKKF